MWRLFGLTLAAMAIWTSSGQAVEFKNVRPMYGPFGASRPSNKVLPGDVIWLDFEILNLQIDAKTGLVKYETNVAVVNSKGVQMLKPQGQKQGKILGLGGGVVPEQAVFLLGADTAPGIYKLTVTVTDTATKASNKFTHEVEVLPPDFGFIHVDAPALGQLGLDFHVGYALVGFAHDKQKNSKITITTRVLDENGKPTMSDSVSKIPDDLPPGQKVEELVRMTTPIFLNRVGRFTLEIEARDEIAKKSQKFSYSFKVMDPAK